MRELGLGAYRLSTAWPRILPEGRGEANAQGTRILRSARSTAFSKPASSRGSASTIGTCRRRLKIAAAGKTATRRHWFAEYAHLTVRRLGDRVKHWATFNEPNCACVKGYGDGEHAPGIRGRLSALKAIHVMNLAHGFGHRGDALGARRPAARQHLQFPPLRTGRRPRRRRARDDYVRRLMEPLVSRPADAGAIS